MTTDRASMYIAVRVLGGLLALAGVLGLILAPVVGEALFRRLWAMEPLTVIGATLLIAGLGATALSYVMPQLVARRGDDAGDGGGGLPRWGEVTQHGGGAVPYSGRDRGLGVLVQGAHG